MSKERDDGKLLKTFLYHKGFNIEAFSTLMDYPVELSKELYEAKEIHPRRRGKIIRVFKGGPQEWIDAVKEYRGTRGKNRHDRKKKRKRRAQRMPRVTTPPIVSANNALTITCKVPAGKLDKLITLLGKESLTKITID